MAGGQVKCLSVIGFSLICLKIVSSPFRPTCNYLGGKKDTFNIFLFFWGLQGWGDGNQNTLEAYHDCICLCVWNLMQFTSERKQEYHYVLRTKISEKSISSYWLSSIGRFREKNETVMWSLSILSILFRIVVDLSVENNLCKYCVWIGRLLTLCINMLC